MTFALLCASMVFAFPVACATPPATGDELLVTAEKDGPGWLGVSIRDMTPDLASSLKTKAAEGALIEEVTADSPADSAGLKREDVVVEFGDRKIYDADDLRKAVRRTKPGESVTIGVDRAGETLSLRTRVGELPRRTSSFGWDGVAPVPPVPPVAPHVMVFRRGGMLGLRVRDVEGQLAEFFGAPEKGGVLVEEVEKDGAGAKAGFKAGDVIVRAGGRDATDVSDLHRALEKKKKGDTVEFAVVRKGSKKTLTATVEEESYGTRMRVPSAPRMHQFHWESPGDIEIDIDREQLHELQESMQIEMDRVRPEMERLQRQLKREGKNLEKQMWKLQQELKGTVRT